MPYCPKCGRFYYESSRSCTTCGQFLGERTERPGDTFGENKSVRKPDRDKRCPYCNNTGKIASARGVKATDTCPVCRGRRFNLIPEDWLWCGECDGSGEFTYGNEKAAFRKPCPECKGTGWVKPGGL